jgi:hypothetical protein
MNATIPQQQQDTTIMGSGVFYAVHAVMLLAGQVRREGELLSSQWRELVS